MNGVDVAMVGSVVKSMRVPPAGAGVASWTASWAVTPASTMTDGPKLTSGRAVTVRARVTGALEFPARSIAVA